MAVHGLLLTIVGHCYKTSVFREVVLIGCKCGWTASSVE